MSQRDYVSRGQSQQKKRPNKQATKKAAPVASFAKVRLAVVVVLLLGFGYFLWSIKDSAEPIADAPVKPPVVNDEEDLPELPEEEWEYIKTLPGYEVEVEVAQQEKSDKRYLMQCASFRTRAQAEEMKAKIAFQGYEALIKPSSGANGDWFRVILGPFDYKRDAERVRHTLRKVNITTCQIWYWNL